ncbi:hypothetical protein CAS74_004720 [Pichia kudriavzevii]|uniref:C2H2-type domain-containing protein n=1 Tax=Pichia kudriavzevii TaxID=4909 RepID=A0A1Z8JIS5_PICKU|nr:hypothetical protein CAS74_004720 [Pichia kudriavzevii]
MKRPPHVNVKGLSRDIPMEDPPCSLQSRSTVASPAVGKERDTDTHTPRKPTLATTIVSDTPTADTALKQTVSESPTQRERNPTSVDAAKSREDTLLLKQKGGLNGASTNTNTNTNTNANTNANTSTATTSVSSRKRKNIMSTKTFNPTTPQNNPRTITKYQQAPPSENLLSDNVPTQVVSSHPQMENVNDNHNQGVTSSGSHYIQTNSPYNSHGAQPQNPHGTLHIPLQQSQPQPQPQPQSQSHTQGQPLTQTHMVYPVVSQVPNHIFATINHPLNSFQQYTPMNYNYPNVYSYNSFPRLNSIVEDPSLATAQRKSSVLPPHEFTNNMNVQPSNQNSSFIYNPNIPGTNPNHQNSMPLLYGTNVYPKLSFDQGLSNYYGFSDTSINPGFSRDYSISESTERLSSSDKTKSSNLSSQNQQFVYDSYLNTNGTNDLISIRRPSEHLDPFFAANLQNPSNSNNSRKNRNSISSNFLIPAGSFSINPTQNSNGSISFMPGHSASNSRRNSFFFRRFPSIAQFPQEFSTQEVDNFLKREGSQDILDQASLFPPSSYTNANANVNANVDAHSIINSNANANANANANTKVTTQQKYGSQVSTFSRTSTGSLSQYHTNSASQSRANSNTNTNTNPNSNPGSNRSSATPVAADATDVEKNPNNTTQLFSLQHQVYPNMLSIQQDQYLQIQQNKRQQNDKLSTRKKVGRRIEENENGEENAKKGKGKDERFGLVGDLGDSTPSPNKGKRSFESNFKIKKATKRRKVNKNDVHLKAEEENNAEKPLIGATKVDQLMLIIQARQNGVCGDIKQADDGRIIKTDENGNEENSILPNADELVGGVEKTSVKADKSHECKYCHKKFTQNTHLDVHLRSHMGVKPYKCEYCNKKFTQGGNLRTHMRLHTGEKPFSCDKCGKKFSRKGNLQAHLLTHENLKPYVCKFDGCEKGFTQLGNLKAHQNRFHLDKINELFNKLAVMGQNNQSIDDLPEKERDLLNYFSSLYKNLNKGIKGRGKSNKSEQNNPGQTN